MGDDLNSLVNVIEDQDGVAEHKDRFRDLKGSSKLSLRFRFEVLDAVVRDESDGST